MHTRVVNETPASNQPPLPHVFPSPLKCSFPALSHSFTMQMLTITVPYFRRHPTFRWKPRRVASNVMLRSAASRAPLTPVASGHGLREGLWMSQKAEWTEAVLQGWIRRGREGAYGEGRGGEEWGEMLNPTRDAVYVPCTLNHVQLTSPKTNFHVSCVWT